MEGIHTLKDLPQLRDWLTKVDLKDAYFVIPIHPDYRKYLRFPTLDKVFQFTCLPFRLSSAPWVFTKTLKPVAPFARELGWQVVFYINNILVVGAQDQTRALIHTLQNPGFILSEEKVILEPTQRLEFLEFTVDTVSMELYLPGNKFKKIRTDAPEVLGMESVSAQALARLLGRMTVTPQVIRLAPLFFRHLQRDLACVLDESCRNYDTHLMLSRDSREELEWWKSRLQNWNGKLLLRKEADLIIDRCLAVGLGRSLSGPEDRRSVVRTGKTISHKLSQTNSSLPWLFRPLQKEGSLSSTLIDKPLTHIEHEVYRMKNV